MATDKSFLLSANLGSKNAIAVITLFSADRYLAIEFTNVEWKARSHFVRLYVANEEVAKSTNSKPQLSALKLGWNADNQMWVFGLDLSVGVHLLESAGLSPRRH
jgi:hypothetical protein